MSQSQSPLVYVASFFISASTHFVVKYSTQTVDVSDVAGLVIPEALVGVITMVAVFVSSQLFADVPKTPEESKKDPLPEPASPTKKKEDDDKLIKAKKVEIIPPVPSTDSSSTAATYLDSPKKGSESRRSFKKDKEVDNLKKRISEFENERRQMDKNHAKRLKERENELLIQHSEERERITQQHKEERERMKREQQDQQTAIKKKAVQEARNDLTQEIRNQLKTEFEKDYDDKLKKEVEALKQKEAAAQEKKKEVASEKKKAKGGKEASGTPKGQTPINLGKANEEEMNKLKGEKEQAQKNYMNCLQNLEDEKKVNEQLKKQIADLQKKQTEASGKKEQKAKAKEQEKEKETKELKAKLEEQAKELAKQIEQLKKNNEDNKNTYETLKQNSFKEIENLKTSHQKELTQLKQNQEKQANATKSQKQSSVDTMKALLAKEFEQRITKQEEIIKQMNEQHTKKLQQLKTNSDKEKQEMQQKFQKEAQQQKSTTRQQLLILERKQKFSQQQNQKRQDYEIQAKVNEAIQQRGPQTSEPKAQMAAPQMIAALQNKLKVEYESMLEKKLKEQEEQSHESARNINDLMRKRRSEYKSEKVKLEGKIKELQAQVTAPQMLTAIKDRLKSEFDTLLEQKMQEQEEKSNESARNINNLMRKRRSEHKSEKEKLEQKLALQEKQIQHLQTALKEMKETFQEKFSQAKDQSKTHQEGVNQEITDLRSQVTSLKTETTQLEGVLQQKDKELTLKESELESSKTLMALIEAQDIEFEKIMKEKFNIQNNTNQKKGKKNKGNAENGTGLETLPIRLKTKFEKIVEASDSKIGDLEYTIDSKETDLQEKAKQMDELMTHIAELNQQILDLEKKEKEQPKPVEEKKAKPAEVQEAKPKEEKEPAAAGQQAPQPKLEEVQEPKEQKVKTPKANKNKKKKQQNSAQKQIQEAPAPKQDASPEKAEEPAVAEQPEPAAVVPAAPLPLFETTFAPGEFSRDKVRALDMSLKQLVLCLREALNGVSHVNGKDIIVCLGNTGSGKTTMLNSLVHGPESLEVIEIKEKVKIKKGKTKEVKKLVIEQKEEFKATKQLKIGHSTAQSETFRPDTVVNEKTSLMFVDMAGFEDAGSPLTELVNMFVNKHIFNISKSISFLLTITMNEITNNRGQAVRELVNVLNVMCPSELSSLRDAVIPVLTKSKPGDQDVDIDEARSSVETTLTEEFQKILQNIQDPKVKEATLNDHRLFVNKFQESLVIFDPLDRPIQSQDEGQADQGTKQKELLQLLNSLQSSRSQEFSAPFTRKSYASLQAIIQKDMKKIDQTINDMIAEAKKQGEKFEKDITSDPVYAQLLSDLKFMRDHNLLAEAADYISKLENKIQTSQTLIKDAKAFEKMNQIGRQAFTIDKKLVQHQNSSSLAELAKGMLDANNFIKDLKKKVSECKNIDEQSELELYKSRFSRKLEDIVTQMSTTSMATLFSLCYELLKLEADCKPEDKFVKEMLDGCMKPSILVDIVCSNKFNQQTNVMAPSAKKHFNLLMNKNNYLVYKKKSLGVEAVTVSNNATNLKDISMKFKFALTNCGGFLVTTEESNILMSESGKVEQVVAQSPSIGDKKMTAKEGTVWTLTPSSISAQRDGLPYFHLEQPYDMVRPRLLCSSDNALTISSKASKKYRDEKSAKWMIITEGE